MPIAKLPDVRLALAFPVFRRRLLRDTVILVREYVEGRSFDNVRPDEEAFDEWKPGMELIVEFLGQEAWLSLRVTNHSVWMSSTWIQEHLVALPFWYSAKICLIRELGWCPAVEEID